MKAWSFIWRWVVCVVPAVTLAGAIAISVTGPDNFMAGAVISMLVMVPAALLADAWCQRLTRYIPPIPPHHVSAYDRPATWRGKDKR